MLKTSTFLSKALIPNHRMVSNGWFPGIKPTNEDKHVIAEVYEVDQHILNSLDILEGVAHKMYTRERLRCLFLGPDGLKQPAWVSTYIYQYDDMSTEIPSGDWCDPSIKRLRAR